MEVGEKIAKERQEIDIETRIINQLTLKHNLIGGGDEHGQHDEGIGDGGYLRTQQLDIGLEAEACQDEETHRYRIIDQDVGGVRAEGGDLNSLGVKG